jgi:hypothetical protein
LNAYKQPPKRNADIQRSPRTGTDHGHRNQNQTATKTTQPRIDEVRAIKLCTGF